MDTTPDLEAPRASVPRPASESFASAAHPQSPAGVTREHRVRCITCLTWTWNHCAQCNQHCGHATITTPGE